MKLRSASLWIKVTYPTTEQGLRALIKEPENVIGWVGPYLKPAKLPMDPWKKEFHYRVPSQRTGYEFDLYSLGEGGQDDSEKILNE